MITEGSPERTQSLSSEANMKSVTLLCLPLRLPTTSCIRLGRRPSTTYSRDQRGYWW